MKMNTFVFVLHSPPTGRTGANCEEKKKKTETRERPATAAWGEIEL